MGDELLRFEQLEKAYNNKPKQLASCKNWFPIYSSKELAEIIAALITDGHIDFSMQGGTPKLSKLILYSNSKTECQWFLSILYSLLRVKGTLIKYKSKSGFSTRSSFKAVVHSSMLAKTFVLLGVPCGDKTKTSYLIPDWILTGSPKIKSAFLRVLFNFDGSISLRSGRPSGAELNYCMNKHKDLVQNGVKFIQQIKDMLFTFGVRAGKPHVRHHKKDKFTIMLFVTNSLSVLNFAKYIQFLNRKKNFRLNLAVNRINKFRRVADGSHILRSLKEKIGTDKQAVSMINLFSKTRFTYRQFEHMRRGESRIPIRMLTTASKILKH